MWHAGTASWRNCFYWRSMKRRKMSGAMSRQNLREMSKSQNRSPPLIFFMLPWPEGVEGSSMLCYLSSNTSTMLHTLSSVHGEVRGENQSQTENKPQQSQGSNVSSHSFIYINQQNTKDVEKFVYLGNTVSADSDIELDDRFSYITKIQKYNHPKLRLVRANVLSGPYICPKRTLSGK